ncbi:MAG TPA: hypothetical protein VEU96_30445 [Bryobacteraceae bacterium]|nr:hypothetical protein [Bryobacteraceae bacterium]
MKRSWPIRQSVTIPAPLVAEVRRVAQGKASHDEPGAGHPRRAWRAFQLCGSGQYPKTFLTKSMKPYGQEIV